MKVTKNQLKELIRHSIREVSDEFKKEKPTPPPSEEGPEIPEKPTTNIEDNPFDKEEVEESVKRRFTVKEVQKWMKTLEENRYKKVYNADCRRVSWMANNMNEDIANMPKSMSKKWTKAQYGRERYLAKEFVKSKLSNLKEQLAEQKLRKLIREVIKKRLTEAKFAELYMKNDRKTQNVVSKIIKKMRLKIDRDYDVKALGKKQYQGDQKFMILPKYRNDFLDALIQNNIKVRG